MKVIHEKTFFGFKEWSLFVWSSTLTKFPINNSCPHSYSLPILKWISYFCLLHQFFFVQYTEFYASGPSSVRRCSQHLSGTRCDNTGTILPIKCRLILALQSSFWPPIVTYTHKHTTFLPTLWCCEPDRPLWNNSQYSGSIQSQSRSKNSLVPPVYYCRAEMTLWPIPICLRVCVHVWVRERHTEKGS